MPEYDNERWQVGDLTVDVGGQTVRRGDEVIVLPQLSFKFLLALTRVAPNVLSADDLMEQVWAGVFVNGETVTQRAKLLRDALGDDAKEPRYFSVRRSAGYQLIPVPIRLDSANGPYWLGRLRRRRPVLLGAIAVSLIFAGGLTAMTVWPGKPDAAQVLSPRIAVLAFDNLSSDPSELLGIEVVRPSLESVFLAVTGRTYDRVPVESAA